MILIIDKIPNNFWFLEFPPYQLLNAAIELKVFQQCLTKKYVSVETLIKAIQRFSSENELQNES